MNNKNIKVALDLDGVIWDLISPWVEKYNELYSDNKTIYDITEYNISKALKKASYDELIEMLHDPNFWENVNPFINSFEYLMKINTKFDLYIVTKTDYRLLKVKVDRLLKLFGFLRKEQIICINNKSLLNVDYLVDDCIDNLKNGTYFPIILDAPYNKNTNFKRVKDLKELYYFLEKRS